MRACFWRRPIGEILIERGLTTHAQVELALALQQRLPQQRVGSILVELGYVKMKDIVRAHQDQLGTHYAKAWSVWRHELD
jgi:hypothetical protein